MFEDLEGGDDIGIFTGKRQGLGEVGDDVNLGLVMLGVLPVQADVFGGGFEDMLFVGGGTAAEVNDSAVIGQAEYGLVG